MPMTLRTGAQKRGIYVERSIRTDLETLWAYTQSPHLHERWDLRFSHIAYLPRKLDEFVRCRYVTRLGLLRVSGVVETTGIVDNANGSRTTKIAFWSDGRFAPIRSGTGYWRYVPEADGIRFISYFEYDMRFGAIGRLANVLLRPLAGWATARSMDVLRLWLEDDVDPKAGRWRARARRCLRTPRRDDPA